MEGGVWSARADIDSCPDLELVLPARKEAVETPFLEEMREAARLAVYRAMAQADPAPRIAWTDWHKAKEAGIEMPEPAVELRPWRPAIADTDYWDERSALASVGKFAIRYRIVPVPDARHFMADLAQGETERVKRDIEQQVRTRLNDAQRDLYRRLGEAVERVGERLREDENGKPLVFRDSLIENIRELVDVVPRLNIFADDDLTMLCREVKDKFAGIEPDALRPSGRFDPNLRRQVKRDADALKAQFAGYFAPAAADGHTSPLGGISVRGSLSVSQAAKPRTADSRSAQVAVLAEPNASFHLRNRLTVIHSAPSASAKAANGRTLLAAVLQSPPQRRRKAMYSSRRPVNEVIGSLPTLATAARPSAGPRCRSGRRSRSS